MPLPNEHSCRVAQPLPKISAKFARKSIAPGVSIILQKRRSDPGSAMKTESYRFGKSQFTPQEAKAWLKSHDITCISFEPASSPAKKEAIDKITRELSKAIL